MKSFTLWLALMTLPLFGKSGGASAPIALYTQFQQAPNEDVLAAIQAEVQAIMSATGLNFEWHDISAADGKHVFVDLAVVTLKGRCSMDYQMPGIPEMGAALGWTHISNGAILPFAGIDCDAVHLLLQQSLACERPESRAAIYGRALGRVMAHELYHIFANTRRHGVDGVGQESYTVQDLLAPSFRFDEANVDVLKSSPARVAVPLVPEESDGPTDRH